MEAGISRLLFSASSSNAEDFDTETEDGEAANRRDALNLDSSLDTGNQDSTDITGSNTPIEETVSRSDVYIYYIILEKLIFLFWMPLVDFGSFA